MAEQVLVLGGGIIGLSCAFEARARGFDVTVVEPGQAGGQASGAAAGMLAPFSENPEQPDAFFQFCLDSHRRYPEWLRRVEEAAGMHIERRSSGSLYIAWHEADALHLAMRLAWQNEYGAQAELLDGVQLAQLVPAAGAQAAAALFSPTESHVYAPSLVRALLAACAHTGVRLLTAAGRVEFGQVPMCTTHDAVPVVETMHYGRLGCDRLIICCGAWTGLLEEALGLALPIHPIRGQICAYPVQGMAEQMIFTSQAYWVEKGNGTLVCGASEDVAGFDAAVTERGISRLERATQRLFPGLAGASPIHRWAGLRPATRDGWPLIGELPALPRVLVAAGHYRNGILLSPSTAALVVDVLEGRAPGLSLAPFAPHRFHRSASLQQSSATVEGNC